MVHHFTPKSNRQSSEWTAHDEPAPKRGKTLQSAGKVMASVFWDAHGIIFIDYLEKGRIINSDYYIAVIGPFEGRNRRKTAAFEEKESDASSKQCTLLKIQELGFELLPRPAYSPDLPPSNYFLFSNLKRMFAGKKFSLNEEVIDEILMQIVLQKWYRKCALRKLGHTTHKGPSYYIFKPRPSKHTCAPSTAFFSFIFEPPS
ncbi:histone-lysine N-methyltransferase SETMAR-like [Rhynchophorus ferrugineus]|uniref:histone-lysine N-methyltransferase SETMAR-like n=1 Tax=Rhynchophorus ferrugineus TaxID=354439 RepID=UPI003FCCDA56